MDTVELDRVMRLSDRNVTFFPNIRIVLVRDGLGNTVQILDARRLAAAWLTTSNDAFFDRYGFNWVPPVWLQDEVRRDAVRGGRHGP